MRPGCGGNPAGLAGGLIGEESCKPKLRASTNLTGRNRLEQHFCLADLANRTSALVGWRNQR